MDIETYNRAVDLWNAGKSLPEIAEAIGARSIYDLHPLTRAATREAVRMIEAGEPPDVVKLKHITKDDVETEENG